MRTFILMTLVSLFVLSINVYADYLPDHIWPISGNTTPNLPLSSAFGPRLKASEDFRYDFHRGIDIPTPEYTPVYAIADGKVRLSGKYPFYTDTLVQLRHYKPGDGAVTCSNRGCYYSNYMHLSSVAVSEGESVKQGDLVGYSGVSESGFPHLHFEIRDKSIYQNSCINPWNVLPYTDTNNLVVSFTETPDFSNPLSPEVLLRVSSSADELDLNRVEVEIYEMVDSWEIFLVSQIFDMEHWNHQYSLSDLDNRNFNGIEISPARFSARAHTYSIKFRFHGLQLPEIVSQPRIKIKVYDIMGNMKEASMDI